MSSIVDLTTLLPKWQKILRLEDWDIHVKMVRHYELAGGENAGSCHYSVTLREATLQVMDPIDNSHEYPEDIEEVLVHELVHLVFSGIDNGETGQIEGASRIFYEQAVEATARALIQLDRRAALARLEGESKCLEASIQTLNSLRSK